MNPFQIFFILLIIVPATEIYFLFQVGGVIGGFETFVLVILTAFIGAYLLRIQGLTTVQRLQVTLAKGELPALEMVEGLLLLICGLFLLTPGFISDAVGFTCLLPWLRQQVALRILKSGLVNKPPAAFDNTVGKTHSGGNIIEGEFEREEGDDVK